MNLTIDHAPIARSDLDDATAEFSRIGLEPEYGGAHANGTTHMAVLGFDDGSYLELISGTDPDVEPDLWPEPIEGNAGPCAWCIEVEDVAETLKRAIDTGTEVRGPVNMARERPDGTRVEWDVGFLGEQSSEEFPFVIADRTPREFRVTPTDSVAGGPIRGIERVVVAVRDLDGSIESFRRLFGLARAERTEVRDFGGEVASFPGEPLALATPLDDGNSAGRELDDRLKTYGERPCACLLGVEDIDVARERYALGDPIERADRRVAFFDATTLDRRLGVVETERAASASDR